MTKIMIVEDEAIICSDIELTLKRMGYRVTTTAARGEEALKKADSVRPDLILMDINLSGKLNGIETADIIRSRFNIPIVFVTAHMDEGKLQQAKLTMPFEYILKPVREKDLKVTIEMAVYVAKVERERKKAEEELKQSRQRFQDIVLSSSDWIWEMDHNGKFTFASKKIKKILGYRPDEILGKTPFDLMPKEESIRVRQIFDKISAKKKPIVDLENWNLTKAGQRVCLLSNGLPLLDDNGELIGYRGTDKDITERKKAEEALQQSGKQLAKVNSIAKMGFLDWHLKTDQLVWSREAYELFGVNQKNSKLNIDQTLELVHTDDLEYVRENLDLAVQGEQRYNIDHRMVRPDGDVIWVHAQAELFHDNHGNPESLLGTVIDITERKQIEEALIKSESKYSDLYDNAPDMYVSVDAKTASIIECNQTMLKATGYSKAEIVGRKVFDIYTPESSVYAREMIFPAFLKTGRIESEELKIRRKDGSTIDVSLNVSAVRDSRGNILYSRSSFRDISEKKRLEKERLEVEKQLFQAQKMESLGTLASGIAHDFNNLLFQILGYTQLAIINLPENDDLKKFLLPVESASNKAAALVRQILNYSRGSIGEFKPLAIQSIIKEVLKLLRSSMPATIEIRQNINEKCGFVFTDVVKIYQVIMNLSTNAYHAMRGKKGILEVTLDEIEVDRDTQPDYPDLNPGNYLKLSVSDTGRGMDEATKAKIFDPLFTTKNEREGTGLGLCIVQKIINEHQGSISVVSTPGKGTTFNVYLPRADITQISPVEQDPRSLSYGTGKIMIVDDE